MTSKFQQHIDESNKKIKELRLKSTKGWYADEVVFLTRELKGFTQALKMVLERIEFIENNSDWNCETLKKEIKESIEIEEKE